MTDLAALTRDYRTAFLRYLPRREEAPLSAGYEICRAAVTAGVSVLELAQIHHEILGEVLADSSVAQVRDVAAAASEFFLEVLATYDMTQRALAARLPADRSGEPAQ